MTRIEIPRLVIVVVRELCSVLSVRLGVPETCTGIPEDLDPLVVTLTSLELFFPECVDPQISLVTIKVEFTTFVHQGVEMPTVGIRALRVRGRFAPHSQERKRLFEQLLTCGVSIVAEADNVYSFAVTLNRGRIEP